MMRSEASGRGGRGVERIEMMTMGTRMLGEARALRAAFPDADAMRGLPVTVIPAAPPDEGETAHEYRAALGYLRDEMLLVRAGRATDLTVLNDEIVCVERLLPTA
jgi:hypothetical protein